MSKPIIEVRNISKVYRLGEIGMTSLREEAARGIQKLKSKFSGNGKGTSEDPEGDFWALKDVSFDVQPGEVVGIIGKNGAGKSTLLKVISRITEPSHGEIRLRGRVAALLEVGTGFHPELTGRENIYLNGTILGMKKREIDRKLDEIIDFSGIENHIDTPVKRYSSGMNVRLGFAVAAHLEPEILIVDEVLAVGDAEFQNKCLGKMKDVAGHGRTVLFVSHNMGAVENLCPRALVIDHGKIITDGRSSESISFYMNLNLNRGRSGLESVSRSGTGEIQLTNISPMIENGEATLPKSMSPLSLLFTCVNRTDEFISTVALGYSISSSRGEKICVQYSDYSGVTYDFQPHEQKTIVVTIDCLPLAPGNYAIGARVVRNGQELDWPKGTLLSLDVEQGAIQEGATHPHSGHGPTIFLENWTEKTASIIEGRTCSR